MFPATSMPDRDWWQNLWPNPEETMSSLGVRSNMTVADLCCGDGYFTVPLAKLVTKVYGLELDSNLLEQASKYSDESGVVNCHWIHGDILNAIDLIPETVDMVVMANTFHGIPDKDGVTRLIAKLLKQSGIFAIINWHSKAREETIVLGQSRGPKTEMRMSPEMLSHIIVPIGFVLEKTIDVSPFHYACMFVKS